jgi:hypothetical protein
LPTKIFLWWFGWSEHLQEQFFSILSHFFGYFTIHVMLMI